MNATDFARTVAAAIEAVADAVRIAGEIPSGHLYAGVCGRMTLRAYQAAIRLLKEAKLVEKQNFLLRWIGPEPSDEESAYRTSARDKYGLGLLDDPEQVLKAIERE